MMANQDDLENRLTKMAQSIPPDPSLVEAVMRSIEARPIPQRRRTVRQWAEGLFSRWLTLPRIPRLATAGSLLVLAAVGWQALTVREATAADVLARGAEAMSKLRSVFMQLRMRTIARDNFELIDVNLDLVPIQLWKQFDDKPYGKWRIEKPERVVVMDGASSLLWIKPDHVARGGPDTGFVCFLKRLLDIHKVIHEATALAFNREARADMVQTRAADGRLKTVITMDVKAQGDFKNTWLLNKTIVEANTRRIYRFDTETNLLEGLEIFVRSGSGDVLVLAVTDIRCNQDLDPALFTLAIPKDAAWMREPEILPAEKYRLMTPGQMAQAFFEACANDDWDEMARFWHSAHQAASEGPPGWTEGHLAGNSVPVGALFWLVRAVRDSPQGRIPEEAQPRGAKRQPGRAIRGRRRNLRQRVVNADQVSV